MASTSSNDAPGPAISSAVARSNSVSFASLTSAAGASETFALPARVLLTMQRHYTIVELRA